jgi:hypothetical protein
MLAVGSALAAGDSGLRKHAEGRYDASTSTYTVVAGDDISNIASASAPLPASWRS